jgi:uncharacterized membrane protein YqjE
VQRQQSQLSIHPNGCHTANLRHKSVGYRVSIGSFVSQMNSGSDPSPSPRAPAQSPVDSIRDLVVSFASYVELRLQLLALESREAASHLLFLALLLVCTLICFGGFIIMSVVFLLYLVMLILHWEWGWSALALGAVLLALSIGAAVIFKFRIAKPFFPATFGELQKDREWLKHNIKSRK